MADARTASCPSCGAPLRFRGATSIVAVCQFCKATLVRDGVNIENIGKQAELLEDMSPIRIGADGKHKGRGFTVVGRIQYRYGAGVWNEWYVLFSDMKGGWLSDASREYTMTFLQAPQPVPKFAELKPGQQVTLGKETYTAMNMEQAEVVAGEGELPFKFKSGWKADVADLRGEGNKFATIDYSEEPPWIYTGEKLPFDQFSFSGLHDPTRIGFTKGRALTFKCGGCGSPLESHLATTEVVACATCGTLTDVTKGGAGEVVQTAEKHKKEFKPTIALGSEGTWKTVRYETVGLMRRQITVDGQKYAWTEYLLHNIERGYAWISEYNGHFSVIHNAAEVPKPGKSLGKPKMNYLGHVFEHFQKSEPRVIYLAGEFYWQVRLGDRAVCNDYVCPPLILSSEATGNELTWSFGEYVPGPDLWAAFKLPGKPPRPIGVAPNQPSPHTGKVAFLWKAFLVFAAIGLVAQVGLSAMTGAGTHHSVRFTVTAGDKGQVVSPPFKLGGLLDGPVTLRTASNVRDTWLNLDLQLTNVDTGRAYGTKRALGFSKVGGQVDGSSDDVGELSSVPPGRYTLAVSASSGASATAYPPPTFNGTVEAYRSPLGWANFWMFLFGIVLWPFMAWRQARAFESHRWSESDYGDEAASSSSDDDDD